MTPDQAREKIKNHIRRCGRKKDIVVTKKLVRRWWNLLNTAVFYGKIPFPKKLEIRRTRGQHAECATGGAKGEPCELLISETFKSKDLFLNVLVHEMVHAWEAYFHNNLGHAKRFWEWKPRIKRTINLELEEKYDNKYPI